MAAGRAGTTEAESILYRTLTANFTEKHLNVIAVLLDPPDERFVIGLLAKLP